MAFSIKKLFTWGASTWDLSKLSLFSSEERPIRERHLKVDVSDNIIVDAITFKGDGVIKTKSGTVLNSMPNNPSPPGGVTFTTPGTYQWVCPEDVTSVCVVAVGGGGGGNQYSSYSRGGGGGGLGWKNNISVTPGQTYNVNVGAGGARSAYSTAAGGTGGTSSFVDPTNTSNNVAGYGGAGGGRNTSSASGGPYTGQGGGSGGSGGAGYKYAGGGGGAGGYSGNGGNAFQPTTTYYGSGDAGTGGGGGGGGSAGSADCAGGGGGVGLYGEGVSGSGGLGSTADASVAAGGGSGGENGGVFSTTRNGNGGKYGGGGGGADNSYNEAGNGGNGAVRIIWGTGRAFPSTNVGILGDESEFGSSGGGGGASNRDPATGYYLTATHYWYMRIDVEQIQTYGPIYYHSLYWNGVLVGSASGPGVNPGTLVGTDGATYERGPTYNAISGNNEYHYEIARTAP